jgi:hypothetical protein
MKKYKVFLASSGELAQERKEIALMISRQNNAWVEKDIYLELVIWEELLHSFRGERIQDYFNRKMLECDIVIVLFFKKVGQFTEEEFKLAYKNLANRKIDISFSFDNSMAHLSKIAIQLMETNRRGMGKKEIETCLPAKIEGEPRDFFLKEMVLKAGLLYESEGKYGFLHLTFQEYLAARYFANSKKQNEILEYRDKDYWKETFKLFVNIGNAELFFDEIIGHLMEKKYWEQIELWEDCMREIVVEGTRATIELKFAKKVISILSKLEYKNKNNKLLNAVFDHYPLYHHGERIEKEGWELFYKAPHPFVQSIGTYILSQAKGKVLSELSFQLRKRINKLEKQGVIDADKWLYFWLQNNNNMVLLMSKSRNLEDFIFVLNKLKSGEMFIKYLALLSLLDLRGLLLYLGLQDYLDSIGHRRLMELINILNIEELLSILDLFYVMGHLDLIGPLGLRGLPGFSSQISPKFQEMHRFQIKSLSLQVLKENLTLYIKKFELITAALWEEIFDWVDQAIEKLHSKSDKELLKYFPSTTKKELKAFREDA